MNQSNSEAGLRGRVGVTPSFPCTPGRQVAGFFIAFRLSSETTNCDGVRLAARQASCGTGLRACRKQDRNDSVAHAPLNAADARVPNPLGVRIRPKRFEMGLETPLEHVAVNHKELAKSRRKGDCTTETDSPRGPSRSAGVAKAIAAGTAVRHRETQLCRRGRRCIRSSDFATTRP